MTDTSDDLVRESRNVACHHVGDPAAEMLEKTSARIERLEERCAAYKTQIEAGSRRIEQLEAEKVAEIEARNACARAADTANTEADTLARALYHIETSAWPLDQTDDEVRLVGRALTIAQRRIGESK